MKIRKRAGEQRPYVQPSPIGLTILPTKKLVSCETRDYSSHEETSVSEAQEQHGGLPKNRRIKMALQDTVSVRNARVRTRTLRKIIHSSVTPLIGSPTPPCPSAPRQLSTARLKVRRKNDGSSRNSAGEPRPYVQPSPIRLATETRDYSSHEETAVCEAQEQHEGSPKNRAMKTALQDTYASTYVRRARAPVRIISLRKIQSSVTPLSRSPSPPCPIPRQLSSARLLVRMEKDGPSRKRAGEQPSYVQPAPIGLAAETCDYFSHEETPESEAQEQHEGLPKNLRRRKTALQDTSVRNARVPKRARTNSLKVKRCVYNFSDNPSLLSSCEGTYIRDPLPEAAATIWMDSTTSATPEPHPQHTLPDFYNLHLLADTAVKVSEAESGKVPMETPQGSLELGNALHETKSKSYEGQSVTETRESVSKQESAMSKAEEQPQDANKTMESCSPDTAVSNHPLSNVSTRTDSPTVQRCLKNRSQALIRTCEGTHSHPLPAAAAAIWMGSTTSATPEPHQQHTLPDFYELNEILAGHNAAEVKAEAGNALPDFYKLNQILAAGNNAAKVKAESGKVHMETPQVSLELGNTLQGTKSQLYEGDSAMETHESGTSKEEPAINEAEEQPQDANKNVESFSPNATVCSLPLCLPRRTDGPKGQTCPDLNLPLSRTAYEATYSHLPAAAPCPSTAALDLTLHRNPGGGHTQLDAANSVNGLFDFASQSAGWQMHASEPMSEATQYPCSAVQRPPTASVSSTSVPICLSNPLQGLSLDEKPKARRGRRRRQQDARRESPQHPPLLRTAYEATRNQPLPAAAPFPSTATQGLTPRVGHMQRDAANSAYGMFSVASQSAELQMHASDPMLKATQYPGCSAAQRPPAAGVSPTSFPICDPLQIQQAVAALLTSGVFVNNLASIILPQLSEQVTRSPANPLGDGLDESSVTTEGATADTRRE